jgi:PPOX class probable F420-dependent enzyme
MKTRNGEATAITAEEREALLSKPNHAIVGVNRAIGAPQLTVVWYRWDGTSFFFSTTKERAKYYNLKRDPSISLLVDDLEGRWYVVAYGQAEILEQNHVDLARPLLEKYVPTDRLEEYLGEYVGDHPKRVIVVVHPEKILTGW